MRIVASISRFAAATLGTLAVVLSAFLAWRGVSDYAMQRSERWTRYCADVWLPCAVLSIFCILLACASAMAYRKSTAWEHSLHGSRQD